MTELEFKCPVCKKPSPVGSPTFPFCSEPCKWVDLGRWLEGAYRIAGEDKAGGSEEGAGSAGPEDEEEAVD